ncbi:6-phosphogluconolactonase [Maricaulis sp.]|uniref:6-phosphogluconolactonase n=1 Tax=Maricaulis sp. TaxID=1486257 RepID=UPI0025BB8F26|nr:6-phosphogluconolactonase [Maricaulis sp.]
MPLATSTLPDLTEHADKAAMAQALAGPITRALSAAIAARGKAVFAVSGGSTPEALYKTLADTDLDWSKVTVVLVDERWVEPGTPGSNESFLASTLMTGKAAAARLVGLKAPGDTPIDGLADITDRLADIAFPPDVVILGMGEDGHTASWFPRADGLDAALAESGPPVAAIRAKQTAVTGALTDRITLTRAALAGAGMSLLLLAGESKKRALEAALADGPVADMPVRALLRSDQDRPDIHWTR